MIGSMIIDQNACSEILACLDETDFYHQAHIAIFRKIKEQALKGEEIEFTALVSLLPRDLGNIVVELATDVVTSMGYQANIRVVSEMSNKRRVRDLAKAVLIDLGDTEKSSESIFNGFQQRIQTVFDGKVGQTDKTDKEIVPEVFEILTKRMAGEITGAKTGIDGFDTKTGGLQPGNIIVIGGRPKMGKTTLAINIADNVAKTGRILFISLEMNKFELMIKRLSAASSINSQRMACGGIQKSEIGNLINIANSISKGNFIIDDLGTKTPMQILNTARRRKREPGGLNLVVVDYLQLMGSDERGGNREREIATISRAMKMMAKELELPVIVLSQLNRKLEMRTDKRPTMADLRESGAIEQGADLITFVHRQHPEDENDTSAEWIIRGHRMGRVGTIDLHFDKICSRFSMSSTQITHDDLDQ